MHKSAIELVGTYATVLENENRAFGVKLPGRAERGLKEREAAAEQTPFRFTGYKRIPAQTYFPAAGHIADGLEKRVLVIPVGVVGAAIQSGGDHRPMKGDPTSHLPQIDLQRGEIAKSDDALGFVELSGKIRIEQIGGAVAAAQCDKAGDLAVAGRL